MDNWQSWTKEELEHQMSPSRWNPNKSCDEVIQQHITICTAETKRAKSEIPNKTDISYGDAPNQKYDLYGTDLPVNSSILLWIHGGYWQEGSKDISALMARTLYDIGLKTIVMGYTLAPQATVKEMQGELFSALKKAIKQFPEAKFIVGGHSAGGQLAASVLHSLPDEFEVTELGDRLTGLFLVAGVYDLRPLVSTYVNDALKMTSDEAETLSPLLQPIINSENFNKDLFVLIWVGGIDSPEFQRQSKDYAAKLEATFDNVKLWLSEEDDHFTIVERLSDVSEASPGSYLKRMLKSKVKL